MQFDLSGRAAIVTGSSTGIGRAIALALAEHGADVVINGRNPAPASAVVEQIQAMGRRSYFDSADIYSYSDVQRMVSETVQRLDKVDIMIACGGAAGPPPQPFQQIDPSLYMSCVESHLVTRLYCIRAALDHMVPRGRGKIVVVTTDAGRTPTFNESLIGGAAAAMVLMTKAIAQEVARSGIRLNTICTTVTKDTPGYDKAMMDPDSYLFKLFQKAEQRIPFGMNRPDDIAAMALFLASGESDQITGQIFSINGGLSYPG